MRGVTVVTLQKRFNHNELSMALWRVASGQEPCRFKAKRGRAKRGTEFIKAVFSCRKLVVKRSPPAIGSDASRHSSMSDLNFVFVSADLDLVEALADVFETAGHTIGDDGRDARAVIVIWSHASRRSNAFLEAAKRATDAGKAVIASRENMLAETIEGAPVFDLAAWDGNQDSPLIDPLFNAVDRALMLTRFDHADDGDEVEHGVVSAVSSDDFQLRRVRTNAGAWKRAAPGLGNAARVLALIAVLAGGTLGFAAMRDNHAPTERVAVAADVDTYAAPTAETASMHVTFADAVTTDASLDHIVPPEPSLPVGYRGREPPSASSLPRRDSAATTRAPWRRAAYTAELEPMLTHAAYQPASSGPLTLSPQTARDSAKPSEKGR
jgi:hypothetical protein